MAAAIRARSERERHGVHGLVNPFGIESPGLTRGLALTMQTDEMGTLQTYENNAGG
jgi:L-2-hydroxyglutarate oxidase LhgO